MGAWTYVQPRLRASIGTVTALRYVGRPERASPAEGYHNTHVEELYPWPQEVGELLDRYPNLEEVVWAQEEPRNMGAWTWVEPRLRGLLPDGVPLRYAGRPDRASPAEGYPAAHAAEQNRIVADALAARVRDAEPATVAAAGEAKG